MSANSENQSVIRIKYYASILKSGGDTLELEFSAEGMVTLTVNSSVSSRNLKKSAKIDVREISKIEKLMMSQGFMQMDEEQREAGSHDGITRTLVLEKGEKSKTVRVQNTQLPSINKIIGSIIVVVGDIFPEIYDEKVIILF